MGSLLSALLRLLVFAVLAAAGLVFVASLLVFLIVVAVGWLLRWLWGQVTGRPVAAPKLFMHVQQARQMYGAFGQRMRPGGAERKPGPQRRSRSGFGSGSGGADDVQDVDVKR